MNNNALISAGVLNTYWSQNRQDTLDLLMPFLKYSISSVNTFGKAIDIVKTVDFFKQEYGYENIPLNVVYVMLNRLSPRYLRRNNKQYIWSVSFETEIGDYTKKKTIAKEKREKVVEALKEHLKNSLSRKDFDPSETMDLLYEFFVENGLFVSKDVSSLISLKQRDGKINYEIARFITDEYRKGSSVFDYIVEMVNGFFVSTAIALQNVNSTAHKARIIDLACYIDTRIIINALGLHLPEARKSADEFLNMLKELGVRLFCFTHNYDEICDVLNAYKNCLRFPRSNVALSTLEALDEQGYTPDDVDRYIGSLRRSIATLGIDIVDAPAYSEVYETMGTIDEAGLKDCLLSNIHYNAKSMNSAVETDIASVSAIMRLRKGSWPLYLEKAKFIFVSTNNKYAGLVAQFLKQPDNTIPCIIGDMDLAAILWLKHYKIHKDYPKSRLIENAMVALEPSPQFISNLFDQINKLEFEGVLSADEVSILRTDIYTKRQAMKLSQGDSTNVDSNMVQTLRTQLRERYVHEEHAVSVHNYQMYVQEKSRHEEIKRRAYEAIFNEGECAKQSTAKKLSIFAKALVAALFLGFLSCLIYSISASTTVGLIVSVLLGLIDVVGFVDLISSKWNFINRWIERKANSAADRAMDIKRDEYESLIGDIS